LNQCTDEDIELLKSRVVTENDPNYPTTVLHVYTYNVDVDNRNQIMLDMCAQPNDQFSITAQDTVSGQTHHIQLSNISNKKSDTGGLHSVLKIAVGASVMLTANIDVGS
jgi:citrate lyase gamma subunit